MNQDESLAFTHTYFFFFLLYALSIKDIGQDLEAMLQHSDSFGLVYDSSAFHLVFTTSYQLYQFPADNINPSQRNFA